ncbi:MAG TPA: class I adenylate-forming enzyme family protein [Rugosimonospora sp.]|nr:class I adenylate-forming enzyme family protein [Rugosimonospora sp.]
MNAENPPTLADTIARSWQRWPERTALIGGGQRLTYAGLGHAVAGLANVLRGLGVGPGDRVVCSVANRCEFVVAMVAAWQCGAVHVGVDFQSTGAELSAVIELTGATALVYEPFGGRATPMAALEAVRRGHPDLKVVAVTDHLLPDRCVRWSVATDGDHDVPAPPGSGATGPDDPAIIFISSGTTGTPKATMGFHGNLARRWQGLAGWLRFGPDDVHLAQLPLSHGFGLMMAIAALIGGGRLVLLERFTAEEALTLIGAEGITVVNGAPAHFALLLSRLDPARHRLDSLRFSVGTAAPFPPHLVNAIWERLGVDFMFMYGSSEGVGVATTDAADILRGSVGRPEPDSVAIVGPDRQPLPIGTTGEVAFSRAVYPVRYWNTTPESPWYYSGDLGHLDEQGRLYIHGRLKHQIDRGGLKVDPVEVEAALLRCPGVADVAVVGQPNPVLGETVSACVVPVPGERPTLDGLRVALGETLAPFKLPEELFVLDAIPRTRIGKVDLSRLRETLTTAAVQRLERG